MRTASVLYGLHRAALTGIYLVRLYEFAERRMPGWRMAARKAKTSVDRIWTSRRRGRSRQRSAKRAEGFGLRRENLTGKNLRKRRNSASVRPDESRWTSTLGWVNLTTASPAEYIRAELWCNGMRKFSRGEVSLKTAIDSYRAAIKRLGIAAVDDGRQVEDRRGREKDEEILRILRASYQ